MPKFKKMSVVSALLVCTAMTVAIAETTNVPLSGDATNFVDAAGDTTPDTFSFLDQTGVEPDSLAIASPDITVSGLSPDTSVPVSVSGVASAAFKIDSGSGFGTFETMGTVKNGDIVQFSLMTGAGAYAAPHTATLTIGGVSDSFTATTRVADTTPNAFTFVDLTGQALSSQVSSAGVTITGLEAPAAITISGEASAQYSLDGGATWTNSAGSVSNNATLLVRMTSSSANLATRTATVTIGGVSDSFSVTTEAAGADTTPDGFTFTAATGAELSTLTTSGAITVSGIDADASISVSGAGTPEYSTDNGATWTATAGTVSDGSSVLVRLTSSATPDTAQIASLTIGGVSANFSVTTRAADVIPEAFTFTDLTEQLRSTQVVSAPATITGLEAAASISISGDGSPEYSLDNGATWTSAAGTVANNGTVRVRLTSSASYATAQVATVTIGGVSDSFSVTTEAAPSDTTPDGFTFTAASNVNPGTLITSGAITVSGIDAPAAIGVSGTGSPEYSTDNGASWTSTSGTVSNGASVLVRLTSGSYAANRIATLTIGGVSGTFSVTTRAADTTPDAFTLASVSGSEPSSLATSSVVTVTGIEEQASVSISGEGFPQYSLDNGATWNSAPGAIANNGAIMVRLTTSASFSTGRTATLSVGGVTADFVATTRAGDTVPDAFTFTDLTGQAVSSVITSAPVTVTGFEAATPITISGQGSPQYSLDNGATWSSSAGSANNGDAVLVRLTSSASYLTPQTATVNIGGVSDDFTVTTVAAPADTTPDAFAFAASNGVQLSTLTTSASATVSGINAATAISVSGQGSPEYSIDNGVTWTSTAGTLTNGAAIKVRLTSAATTSTTYTANLDIGGVSANYVVTTRAPDQTPDATTGFTTQNVTNAALSTVYTTNPVTITGMDPGVATNLFVYGVTTSARNTGAIKIRVNGGAWVAHNTLTTVQNGDTIEVQMTSAASTSSTHTAGIYVNSVLWTTWAIATRAPDSVPDAFTINNITRAMRLTDYVVPVNLTGFETTVVRGKTNATVSKDGSSYSSSVTIAPGDTVYVKVTTSPNINTGVTATITTDYGGAGAADKSFSVTTKPNEGDAYSTALGTAGTVDTKAVKNFYSRVVYIGSTGVLRSVAVTECSNLGAGWYLPNYTAHGASLNTNRSTLFGTTSKAIWNDTAGTVTQLSTILVNNAATGSTTADVVCLKTDPTVTLP